MHVQTTDPISGKNVTAIEHAPFVVEGSGGNNALKIHFESEHSRQAYLEILPATLAVFTEPVQGLRG
jgi:hypothetical protein